MNFHGPHFKGQIYKVAADYFKTQDKINALDKLNINSDETLDLLMDDEEENPKG